MSLHKQEQDNRKFAAVIGFWSALLMAMTNLWFYVAFLPYGPVWSAPWPGMVAGLAGLILGILAPVLLAFVFRRDIFPSVKTAGKL